MGAAGIVAELLEPAPRLKVLATSREALRLQAEREFPVPSSRSTTASACSRSGPRAVRPDFRIDESNRELIDRICRRLEGVPLAIELAAARTKLLPPEALLERLDHRLDFLVGGARDLPERQQALRRTIEWSYDLLDEAERRAVRAASACSSAASRSPRSRPVPSRRRARRCSTCSASLVDKSLVRVEADRRRAPVPDARDDRGVRPRPAGCERRRRSRGRAPCRVLPRPQRRRSGPGSWAATNAAGWRCSAAKRTVRPGTSGPRSPGSSTTGGWTTSPTWRGRCGCRRGSTAGSMRAGGMARAALDAGGEMSERVTRAACSSSSACSRCGAATTTRRPTALGEGASIAVGARRR